MSFLSICPFSGSSCKNNCAIFDPSTKRCSLYGLSASADASVQLLKEFRQAQSRLVRSNAPPGRQG